MNQKALSALMQHIPRINGDIPSTDEATSDHQRLLDRYQNIVLVGFIGRKVRK